MSFFIIECSFLKLPRVKGTVASLGSDHLLPGVGLVASANSAEQVSDLFLRRRFDNLSYQLPVTRLYRLNYADYKPKPRGCQGRDERPKACPDQSEGTNDEGN
jgi:hypothetical protein